MQPNEYEKLKEKAREWFRLAAPDAPVAALRGFGNGFDAGFAAALALADNLARKTEKPVVGFQPARAA